MEFLLIIQQNNHTVSTPTILPFLCDCQKETPIPAYHQVHQPTCVCRMHTSSLSFTMYELHLLLSEVNHWTHIWDHIFCHLFKNITPGIWPLSPQPSACFFPWWIRHGVWKKNRSQQPFQGIWLSHRWSEASFEWKNDSSVLIMIVRHTLHTIIYIQY